MKILTIQVFLAILFSVALSQDEENCEYCVDCARIGTGQLGGLAQNAAIEKWPWAVSLGIQPFTRWKHYCGGIIMSDHSILTTAHCFYELRSFRLAYKCGTKIRVGDQNLNSHLDDDEARTYEVNTVLWHPKYRKNGPKFDLAIVYTKTKIEFNSKTKPICLPTVANPGPDTYVNDEVKFAGWGFHDNTQEASDNLREANFTVLPQTECLSSQNYERIQGISQYFFCAGKDSQLSWTCAGDSGSGLVKKKYPNNSQPYYQLVALLHGSKSNCVDPNSRQPSMFVNLEQEDNFEFINRWKDLNSLFDVENEEHLPSIRKTMTNPNPVDPNGNYLLDISRQARNDNVSKACLSYFIDGVKEPGNPFINCEATKILVATGSPLTEAKKVEVIDLVSPSKSCTLSDFPIRLSRAIGAFTPLGPTICSGYNHETNSRIGDCFTLKSNGGNFLHSSHVTLNTPRNSASGFVSDLGELFISGGLDNGGNNMNSGEIINFDQNIVDDFVLTEKIRGHCSILVNSSTAMILGGYDGSSSVKSTYFLDLNTYQVTDGPKMQERRWYLGCAVFEHNKQKFVIAAGGLNPYLKSTEILNLETEIWTTGPQLPVKMYDFPLVSTSIGILAVGGYDRTNGRYKNEVLKLQCPEGEDVSACRWITHSQRLQVARSSHVVIPLPSSYEICNG